MSRPSIQRRFGQRVRAMRTARRWTQNDLADKCGNDRATIYAIERGRDIRLSTVELLAKAFGVSVRRMFPIK